MMKITKEELKRVFDQKSYPKMRRLEHSRRKIRNHLLTVYGILAVIDVMIALFLDPMASILFGLSLVYFSYRETKKICHDFIQQARRQVKSQVLETLLDECHHQPDAFVSQSVFNKSDFNRQIFEDYSGENYVKARLGDLQLESSQIRIGMTERDEKGHLLRSTVFNAPFISMKLPQDFKHNLMILNHDGGIKGGMNNTGFFDKCGIKSYSELKLDSSQGENSFYVYSTDEFKTRSLLSGPFLQKLMLFKEKYKTTVDLNVKGDCVYMVLDHQRELFKPHVFGNIIHHRDMEEFYDLFDLMLHLRLDLQLDQKAS